MNEDIFFDRTTSLIKTISNNISLEIKDIKKTREIAYSYLIQFILVKVLVDNKIEPFLTKYNTLIQSVNDSAKTKTIIEDLTKEIQKNIYKPFNNEQNYITEEKLSDIIDYINDFNFAEVENDILGDIYENFLKTQYGSDLGQFFTPKPIVKYMLKEIGYTTEYVKDCITNNKLDKLSIIDPSCGSGTFLYSATDIIVKAVKEIDKTPDEKAKLIEEIVNNNIFGLDVEEFSLYLAEMSILMRLLPFIYNKNYKNPLEKKLKLFKTKDSIAEFIDLNTKEEQLYRADIEVAIPKRRFDFVIGNPPYVPFAELGKHGLNLLFRKMMLEGKVKLNDFYGINLHSTPFLQKHYPPHLDLYAFFIALGYGLSKDGAVMSYIIPQTLLFSAVYDTIRYHLSKEMTIEKIITFTGKIFVGRGSKKRSEVATSSMILVVRNTKPATDHKVKIINYKTNDEIEKVFKTTSEEFDILQSELLENVENWYYITKSKEDIDFLHKYNKNKEDTKQYYTHTIANTIFRSKFYFDNSFFFLQEPNTIEEGFNIPTYKQGTHLMIKSQNYITKQKLEKTKASQGYDVFKCKYKIFWYNMNFLGYYFTDLEKIMPKGHFCITTDNKPEALYLFALLNSETNKRLLKILKYNPNERNFTITLTNIKQFVRVPKLDTQEQIERKQKVIELTEEMLELEKQEQVDFIRRDKLKEEIDKIIEKMYGIVDI